MYTKQEIIIQSYREGKSQRSISRDLQISRRTVKKHIEEFEKHQRASIQLQGGLGVYLSQQPTYTVSNRSKLKLTQEVQNVIDALLQENDDKRRSGLRKQMLKKHDIYEHLKQQGVDIGYTTVCNYIRAKTKTTHNAEAFIRQTHEPGAECEFDWGEIKLKINDKLTTFQLAVFTASYSNYRYASIYQRQDALAFMESHVSFFDYTQCVFGNMVYDNMRVAVAKFVGKHEKEPTRALLQMRGHYGFSHRFCNAYRGNEKGHVERSVEYVRRKAFGTKSSFDTLETAQQWLISTIEKLNDTKQQLTGQTANQMFDNEKKVMSLPASRLACSEHVQLKVDKYSTICYRTNRYSVPDHLVGQYIDVRLSSHHIDIYENNKKIASHNRDYSKHQWIIKIEHYLATFAKKPGALKGSVALANSSYLKRLYFNYFSDTPRDFIDLLDYCHKHAVTNDQLDESVSRLIGNGTKQISAEHIKALLGNKRAEQKPILCNQTTDMAQDQLVQIASLMQ